MEVTKQTMGQKDLQEIVLGGNLCTGCGACIELCPYFKSYRGKTAVLFPCTLPRGRCFAYCPKVEVDLDRLSRIFFGRDYSEDPLGSYRGISISRAGEKIAKAPFQAGGSVSALIYFAMKKGYLKGAVLTGREGLLPVPRFVTKAEEVFECVSSKYTAAPTLSALNAAMKDGVSPIGIVATPCQALAAALIRSNPMEEKDFVDPTGLVVGLFCTWALDYRAFEKYITERVEPERIRSMDIPPPPADILEIHLLNNEKLEIPLEEIRPLIPEGCSYCIDMTAEFSDISVGVLEGRPEMNTLIVRTERGRRIVDAAEKEGYLTVSDMPGENLRHLQEAAWNKKTRGLRKAKEEKRISGEDQDACRILRAAVLENMGA